MSFFSNNKISVFFILLLSISLVIFVAVKASIISFTHDESFTYLHYVHMNFMDIISLKHPYTNNHILNSVLMKYSEAFFGSNELALRLPNILALVIYLFYAFRIFYTCSRKFVLLFFILLVFNPYLLDFFGLARGYGLSFAFMLMSIYHLIRFLNSGQKKDLIWFNAAALLASLSNFTLLNYYAAALVTYNLIIYLDSKTKQTPPEKFSFFRSNKINIISLFISGIILYEPLRRILRKNMLDFGGKSGFVEDTVGSLVNGLAYETPLPAYTGLILNLFCSWVVLLISAIVVLKLIRKNADFIKNHKPLIVVHLILMMIVGSSVLQHLFMNNDFYVGRFALFIYPLFVMNLTFFVYYLYSNGKKLMTYIFSGIVSFILFTHLLFSLNLSHCHDWSYDMNTKTVMAHLEKDHEQNKITGRKTTLGINWLFEPSVNFYRYIHDLDWLYPVNREGIKKEFDYYYIFGSDSIYEKLKDKKVLIVPGEFKSVLLKN